jgi:hypothetical protein
LWLWKPIIANPPIYTLYDLRHWVTAKDVFEAHEALAIRELVDQKSLANMKKPERKT